MIDSLVQSAKSFTHTYGFSRREASVFLGLVSCGTKHSDLARELDISPNTLRIHLRNMNLKAGTSGISSLLRKFIEFCFDGSSESEVSSVLASHQTFMKSSVQ